MTELSGTINITTDLGQEPEVIQIQLPGAPGPQGAQGIPGQANVLTIGTVTTRTPGTSATATITGVSPNQVLNLGIPSGLQGVQGAPNVLTIGTVTTTDAVTGASATITGTSPSQILNLVLPRGYGVIPAGAAGTVLVKNTATDYDTAWETPTGTGSLVRKSYVDAKVSKSGDTMTGQLSVPNLKVPAGSFTTTTTPGGASVPSKIDVVAEAPGGYGQVIALGIPSTAPDSARVLSVFDGRTTTNHQPSLGVFSPGESDMIGFSWDGSNATASVKTLGAAISLRVSGTDMLTATTAAIDTHNAGLVNVKDPVNPQDGATKNYVDAQSAKSVKNTGQQIIDDSAGAANDTVLTLKAPGSFAGPFLALFSGGTKYLTLGLSTGSSEPLLYNPYTGSTNQAVQIGNVNGSLRILPYNDGNTYIQSTQSGLAFTGLNGADGTTLTFGYTGTTFHGSVAVAGKVTNVTNPTAAQDAATKNYVDTANTTLSNRIAVWENAAYASVHINVDQSVAASTWTTVLFDTKYLDTGIYSTTTGRFTAAVAGVYELSATAFYGNTTSTAGQDREVQWLKNGVVIPGSRALTTVANPAYVYQLAAPTRLVQLAVGDYVQFQAWHNGNAAIPLRGTNAATAGDTGATVRLIKAT